MTGVLEGLKVIEVASIGPGPFCGMMLADHGADVVTIDRQDGKVTGEMPVEIMRRSRRSIALNLKDPKDVRIFLKMVKKADVLIEGFRPGVMERLGIGPDVCLERNPKLVYGRVTGWGQAGPLSHLPGHDLNYISISGAVDNFGISGSKPMFPANLLGDYGAGAMFLAFGVLAGIYRAKQSGIGQVVDAAMIDGAAMLMTMLHELKANDQWQGARGLNVVNGGAHYYNVYETRDGKFVSVAAAEPQFYGRLIKLLNLEDNAAVLSQGNHETWPAQRKIFEEVFRSRTRQQWCDLLEMEEVCFAPVLSMDEAAVYPHNTARNNFLHDNGRIEAAPAPRFAVSGFRAPCTPTPRGADRSAILADYGIEL